MNKNNMTCRQVQVSNTYRRLWHEHALWTRSFIVSASFGLPDLDLVEQRLLQNPRDFARELKPLYGAQKAEQFNRLLSEHLQIAGQMISAEKAGDRAEAERLRRLWYANAEEIASFLASINPFWSEDRWRKLFFDHLQMVDNEAAYILSAQYEKGIREYDALQAEALEMADLMSCGVIRQFGIK